MVGVLAAVDESVLESSLPSLASCNLSYFPGLVAIELEVEKRFSRELRRDAVRVDSVALT